MKKIDLQEELKKSILAKDEIKVSVLRLLLSAINYYEIQKGGAGYEALDEDILSVIQKEVKQRKDSIEEFKKGNRQDLIDRELKELEILKTYLPKQLSEDEVKKLVQEAISQSGAKTIADMGKVMKIIIPQTKGKADGSIVSKIVKEKLSS